LSRTASPCIVAGYNFTPDNFIFPAGFDYSTNGFTTIAGYFAEIMTPGGQPRYPCYDALALDLVSRCRGVVYLRLSARTWRIPYGLPCQSI
jgi:hypothetical protein